MLIKTSELTGDALDYAVAVSLGWFVREDFKYGRMMFAPGKSNWESSAPNFSSDPALAYPIIDRERIGVWPSDSREGMWASRPDYKVYPERLPPSYGPTSLIAAMRCYVASKMGDEVDVPEELI